MLLKAYDAGDMIPSRAMRKESLKPSVPAMPLKDIRKAMELTQEQMAQTLGTTQDNVSRVENRTDLLVSTLKSYVEAMGGSLTMIAEFPAGIRLLDKAVSHNPDYAFAKAFAAYTHCIRWSQTWATADDISKGGRLAHEALVSSRDEPTTIAFAAHVLAWLTRDYGPSRRETRDASAALKNSVHHPKNTFATFAKSALFGSADHSDGDKLSRVKRKWL